MTIAGSIFLIATGAILRFALNVHVKGVSLDTVGLILMIAGLAGLVLGLVQYWLWTRRVQRADARFDDHRDPPPPAAY
jgi:membrane protein implicated in regulation of membrane protease activity